MPRFEISSVRELKWADSEQARLNCRVTFANHPTLNGPQPFTAVASDPGWKHSEEIFARALSGEFGPIEPYSVPTPVVPASVTPAQAKITLFEVGLLDDVEALVSAHPYRPVAIWWDNAVQFDRDNAYLQALGMELGLTDEQVDDMFIEAAKK